MTQNGTVYSTIEKIKKKEEIEENINREFSDSLAALARVREQNTVLSHQLEDLEKERGKLQGITAKQKENLKFERLEKRLWDQTHATLKKENAEKAIELDKQLEIVWSSKRALIARLQEETRNITSAIPNPEELSTFRSMLDGTFQVPSTPTAKELDQNTPNPESESEYPEVDSELVDSELGDLMEQLEKQEKEKRLISSYQVQPTYPINAKQKEGSYQLGDIATRQSSTTPSPYSGYQPLKDNKSPYRPPSVASYGSRYGTQPMKTPYHRPASCTPSQTVSRPYVPASTPQNPTPRTLASHRSPSGGGPNRSTQPHSAVPRHPSNRNIPHGVTTSSTQHTGPKMSSQLYTGLPSKNHETSHNSYQQDLPKYKEKNRPQEQKTVPKFVPRIPKKPSQFFPMNYQQTHQQ